LTKHKARADIKDFETLEDGQEVGIEGVFGNQREVHIGQINLPP